ncbi:MAG: hypothetical protein ACRDOW_01525 [Nocardioidaceae bacterium]
MPNLADNDDVLEVTVPSSGEGGSELDEHPTPVVFGRDDQHGVGCEHGVEVFSREHGGDSRERSVVVLERDVRAPAPIKGELVASCDHSGLHRLNVLGVGERTCHIDLHAVKIYQPTVGGPALSGSIAKEDETQVAVVPASLRKAPESQETARFSARFRLCQSCADVSQESGHRSAAQRGHAVGIDLTECSVRVIVEQSVEVACRIVCPSRRVWGAANDRSVVRPQFNHYWHGKTMPDAACLRLHMRGK